MNDAPSSESPATPSTETTPDPGAGATSPATPDLIERLDRASDRALDAAGATAAKRGSGKRGPDKQKRRPGSGRRSSVPVGEMAGSSAEALFQESETLADTPGDWADAPGIDAETAEALADVVCELFKDGRQNFWRLKVLGLTGSKLLADEFITPISPKLENAMRKSAKALVIKWGAQIEYAPEITFLGAAAVITVSDFLRFRAMKKEHEKIAPHQQAA